MTYAYITGGGTKWIYDSLKNGGASRWFLGARIPYNQKDFNEILGSEPFDGKYVSERTAAQLSVAAYSHAVNLTGDEEGSIGLGVTAKLGTLGQRKGRENKIIISITKVNGGNLATYTFEHVFASWIPRIIQERQCSKIINDCLLSRKSKTTNISEKFFKKLENLRPASTRSLVMYSGSFNPIHKSHIDIIRHATTKFSDYEFCLEIPTRNFSKGLVGPYEMGIRRDELGIAPQVWWQLLVFSKASTFVQKAEILCASGYTSIIFPMGDDTYDRIPDTEKDTLVSLGASILLFKRNNELFVDEHPVIHQQSKYLPRLQQISSTEIRKNAIQK